MFCTPAFRVIPAWSDIIISSVLSRHQTDCRKGQYRVTEYILWGYDVKNVTCTEAEFHHVMHTPIYSIYILWAITGVGPAWLIMHSEVIYFSASQSVHNVTSFATTKFQHDSAYVTVYTKRWRFRVIDYFHRPWILHIWMSRDRTDQFEYANGNFILLIYVLLWFLGLFDVCQRLRATLYSLNKVGIFPPQN